MPDMSRARRRLSLLLAGALTGVLLAPAGAHAAIAFSPCSPAGYECGTLDVPLDRTGAVPGTVTLNVTRVVSANNPSKVAVVALAGGPGQAAVPLAQDFAETLGAALPTRDLLVYDQRGTGDSSRIDCPALSSGSGTLVSATTKCAEQLGAARGFFRTSDSVADLEALRIAGGYTKLVLYGVSYGTKVAEDYAAAYPQNVESLILDSTVTPEGPDAFERSSLAATPRILDTVCAFNRCSGITTSASGDLGKLTAKLRNHPLKGHVYSPSGGRYTGRLTETGLSRIILSADLNPALRASLPGAMRAALTGDPQPILRASARATGLDNAARPRQRALPTPAGYQTADEISPALFVATVCEESQTLPWDRTSTPAQRIKLAEAAAKTIPAGSIGPFSTGAALAGSYLPQCVGWPDASPAPTPDPPLPAVPTLVISGMEDFRTPLEDATGIAQRIGPTAQLLPVPNTGHSVAGSDESTCTSDAIAAFFAGAVVAQCAPDTPTKFLPAPKPPKRFASLKAYTGVHGTAGKTVQALRLTVNDARQQVMEESLQEEMLASAGGLRGGSVSPSKSGQLKLRSYSLVPGVTVSGIARGNGTSTFTISGSKAARGTVRVTSSLAVTGRLGGRKVSTRFGASSRGTSFGTQLAQAIALSKRIHAGA